MQKIAQSAVSRKIKLLEEELGLLLFQRDRSKVTPTEGAIELYSKLYPLYQQMNSEVKTLSQDQAEIKGSIRIGCLREFGELVLFPFLKELRKQYPLLNFDIQYLKSYEIEEKIRNRSIDFGVVLTPLEQEGIRSYQLVKQESHLYTSSKNKLSINSPTDVYNREFIGYRTNDPLLKLFIQKKFKGAEFGKVNLVFAVNSHEHLVEMLKDSNYFCALPSLSPAVLKSYKSGKIQRVSGKSFTSPLYLSYLENPYLEKRKEIFSKGFLSYCKGLDFYE